MEPFLIVVALVTSVLAVVFLSQLRDARQRLQLVHRGATQVDDRLEALRKELGNTKEELQKKTKALEAVKEEARKKARRDGKKAKAEEHAREKDDSARVDEQADAESKRLKKALAAVEQQLATLRAQAEQEKTDAVAEATAEVEKALHASREKAAAAEQRFDELRATMKRKEDSRPNVPGSSLDLKALPKEAVEELSRYFRKAEEYERLYGVSQGKLLLSQERQQELQRRYYAVCRELALAAGQAGNGATTDEDARLLAEAVVNRSDAAMSAQRNGVGDVMVTSASAEPSNGTEHVQSDNASPKNDDAGADGSISDDEELASNAAMPVADVPSAEASPEA